MFLGQHCFIELPSIYSVCNKTLTVFHQNLPVLFTSMNLLQAVQSEEQQRFNLTGKPSDDVMYLEISGESSRLTNRNCTYKYLAPDLHLVLKLFLKAMNLGYIGILYTMVLRCFMSLLTIFVLSYRLKTNK